eukprot:9066262-Pyramimonas_sp.AAC.1
MATASSTKREYARGGIASALSPVFHAKDLEARRTSSIVGTCMASHGMVRMSFIRSSWLSATCSTSNSLSPRLTSQ